MPATDSCAVAVLEVFYERYAIACSELGAQPLPPEQLRALMEALVERSAATIH